MGLGARRLAVAALVALAAAVVVLVITSGGDGYRLRVQMADAAGLRKDFLVKIDGAPVGKVTKVDLDRRDHAVATLELDRGAAPVGTDARAAIRASNLLGEKYVDLVPGDVAHPAPSGFEIPRTRTTTPSDLDDVLSVLDPDTRVALGAFLVGQGDALVGRGADLATTLERIPPTLDAAGRLVSGLAQNNRALGSLVQRADRIVATLAPQRRSLGRLVGSASGAFTALDARRSALRDTVRSAPGAVAQLRRSLTSLQDAATPLRPAARGLQATAAPLTQTLRALPSFTAAAGPALRTVRDVSPTLGRLGREASPVVTRLRSATQALSDFATAFAPVSRVLDQGIADTLGLLQGWARAIQNRDGAGHVFRVSVELGGDVLNAIKGYVDQPAARRTKDRRPAGTAGPIAAATEPARAPEAQAPAPKRPGLKLPGLPKIPLPPVKVPGGDQPGTPGHAVQSLLDFLLKP